MNKKIPYLNTLKLIACFAVFICHFRVLKYTAWGLDTIINHKPFTFLANGSLAVVMFIMISCLLTTKKTLEDFTFENIKVTMIKRYFRLVIPITCINAVVFIMSKFNMFSYANKTGELVGDNILKTAYQYDLGILHFFSASFIDIIWKGDSSFNYPLWMINILFIGMFASVLICISIYKNKKSHLILFGLIIAACWNISFLFVFLAGTILGYLIVNNKIANERRWLGIVWFF